MKRTSLFLVVILLLGTNTFSQNEVNIEKGKYEIVNISGLLMDLQGYGKKNGTRVHLWNRHGKWNQAFIFVKAPGGYWYIYNEGAGKFIDVAGTRIKNGSHLQLWQGNASNTQKFKITSAGDGFVYIEAYNTGLCVTPEESSPKARTRVGITEKKEISKWLLVPEEQKELKPSSNPMVQNFDKVTDYLKQIQDKVDELCDRLSTSRRSIDNVGNLSKEVGKLEDRSERIGDVLATFNMIPTIGTATKVVSTILDRASDAIGKVKLSLDGINKGVVGPSKTGINKAHRDAVALNLRLKAVELQLYQIRKDEQTLISKLNDQNKADSYRNFLNDLISEIKTIDSEVNEINSINNKVLKINNPVGSFKNGVKKVDKVVDKADNIAGKIDKVLSKKFKKKIFRKTISVSLKDVLTGGGLAKKVRRFTKKWSKKLLNPVMKKLKIKMPSIPGVDKVKDAMNKAKNFVNKMVDKSGGLRSSGDRITKLQAQFSAAF